MLRIPLITDATDLLLTPRWADLGPVWQVGLLALMLMVPVGLIAWLYRHELRLVHRWHARALLAARLLLVLVLWLIVALQPVLSHHGVEAIVGRVSVALDQSASMDVIDAQRTAEETDALARALGADPSDVAGWSRREIARRVLTGTQINLLQRLAANHRVELIGFDEARWPLDADSLQMPFASAPQQSAGHATDLRHGLADRGGTGPLAGVILLTDGRHNRGGDPLGLARQLGAAGVPIYPVAIGSAQPPPDLLVADLQAPARIVKDATLPVGVRVKALQLPPQDLVVELVLDGQNTPAERRHIQHHGSAAAYDVRFEVPIKTPGMHEVTVRARCTRGAEITLANNQRTHVVHVADERTRVLLADEEARWEYHYLAAALARDPSVRLDRVLFAPPRLGLIQPADADAAKLPRMHLPDAPADGHGLDPLFDYDCILLGDVGPDRLSAGDRKRLECYVAEHGGTLVLIAGKRAMPMAYAKDDRGAPDPLLQMLPIREPRIVEKREGFALRLTEAGKQMAFLRLTADGADAPWSELPPHYWGIVGTRQPGASILAVPAIEPLDEQTGLLVHHAYGFGKVVFVGIDSTWRWRQRVGDAYHHRFWGQLLRWAAADRLLPAGNDKVRFGSRAPVYRAGQPIELAARLTEQAPPLQHPQQAQIKVVRTEGDKAGEPVAIVPLRSALQRGRLLEGKLEELPAGKYTVHLDIAELGAVPPATFMVLPDENRELLDLSTNLELLRALAQESNGRLFTPADVAQVVDLLAQRVEPWEHRQDSRLWQDTPLVWWTLGVLLGLLALEWGWRKRLDLP